MLSSLVVINELIEVYFHAVHYCFSLNFEIFRCAA